MAASPSPEARLFVGIFVPDDLHGILLTERQAITGHWRWTPPPQWHVTLQFLGNVARERIPDLLDALRPLAAHAPLPLTIGGWAGFPKPRRAHVLVREVLPTPALAALWQDTVERVAPWVAKPEKRSFRPHITLGRSRQPQTVLESPVEPLDWIASHVHLIESRLLPTGSSYEVRGTVALGGGP